MKIRLEQNKTSLRISKPELELLIKEKNLSNTTTFPNGNDMTFLVSLANEQRLSFEGKHIIIELPNHIISSYSPEKIGLSFYFQLDSNNSHELLFEVDIKKKPLKFRRPKQS